MTKMTRSEMQTEALIIETLLDAAMAMHSGKDPQSALTMVELAHDRANRLHIALDSLNAPKVQA